MKPFSIIESLKSLPEALHMTKQCFPGTVDSAYTYFLVGTEGALFTKLRNFNSSMDE